LEEDESPEDFDECQCGGKLYYSETKPGRSRLKFYGTLSLIVIITMAAVGFFVSWHPISTILYPHQQFLLLITVDQSVRRS
jgi:hypothetical protein